MSETATEAPPAAPAEVKTPQAQPTRTLVGFREPIETGMPTRGIGILVGQVKSGKTTLANSVPNNYMFEFENGGADRLGGRIEDVKSLTQFREGLKMVIAEKSIKAIVIDTIDALQAMIEKEVAAKFGLENITDRQKGVDSFEVWGELKARMEGLIGYLEAQDKLVIMLAHYKDAVLDSTGTITAPAGLNLRGSTKDYLPARAKFIGHVYKADAGSQIVHYVSFKGGPLGAWGSRVDELNSKVLTIPKANPWGAIEAVFKAPVAQTVQAKPVEAKAAPKGAKK
jgi:hypothetical protein